MMTDKAIARFCQITVRAWRLMEIANGILRRLSLMSTTSAVSMATSVPAAPIAMPIVAVASAGASLTPSPTIATGPIVLNDLITLTLSSGSSSA